jgi:hypothetical protein
MFFIPGGGISVVGDSKAVDESVGNAVGGLQLLRRGSRQHLAAGGGGSAPRRNSNPSKLTFIEPEPYGPPKILAKCNSYSNGTRNVSPTRPVALRPKTPKTPVEDELIVEDDETEDAPPHGFNATMRPQPGSASRRLFGKDASESGGGDEVMEDPFATADEIVEELTEDPFANDMRGASPPQAQAMNTERIDDDPFATVTTDPQRDTVTDFTASAELMSDRFPSVRDEFRIEITEDPFAAEHASGAGGARTTVSSVGTSDMASASISSYDTSSDASLSCHRIHNSTMKPYANKDTNGVAVFGMGRRKYG